MDEPSFTQPSMYSGIVARDRVPDLYLDAISEEGIDIEEIARELEEYTNFLSEESKKAETYEAEATHLSKQWIGIESAPKSVVTHFDTGESVKIGDCRLCTVVHFLIIILYIKIMIFLIQIINLL